MSPAPMGVPITFSVDAAGAGEGTLELVVSTANNTVKAEVSTFDNLLKVSKNQATLQGTSWIGF